MKLKIFWVFAVLCGLPLCAVADMSDAYQKGFTVWEKTFVKLPFRGCDTGQILHFTNGASFQCTSHEMDDQNDAQVTILKNPKSGQYKVFFGDEEYQGHFLEAAPKVP